MGYGAAFISRSFANQRAFYHIQCHCALTWINLMPSLSLMRSLSASLGFLAPPEPAPNRGRYSGIKMAFQFAVRSASV
jgi:hypothetical protein